jgi:hypothetical protein
MVPHQIAGGARRRILLKIGRQSHYRKTQVSAKRDRDHITRHHTPRPNTGVEAVSDDVDQAALGDEVNLHVWTFRINVQTLLSEGKYTADWVERKKT